MKSKKIIIMGGGGHAKVLIEAILSTDHYKIKGILDKQSKKGEKLLGSLIIGTDEYLDMINGAKDRFCLAIGVGFVKASKKRKIIYEKFITRGFDFPFIVHKYAYVSKSAKLQDGVQIMVGAIIQADAEIGENTIINTAAVIEHDCKIGPHSHISVNAVLGGKVEIGECSHIGMGARILQGVKIGTDVTVGAGAVVIDDVANGRTVVGIPAREMNE